MTTPAATCHLIEALSIDTLKKLSVLKNEPWSISYTEIADNVAIKCK